jgi:prolyl-tRNA editing enzyme YbaK/EbsC (Cys-tRNA(Pro) deacylase)
MINGFLLPRMSLSSRISSVSMSSVARETVVLNSTLDEPTSTRTNGWLEPSTSLVFSNDPAVDSSRRSSFQRLHRNIASLGHDKARFVRCSLDDPYKGDESFIHVNTLVFQKEDSGEPILVIVASDDKVNVKRLEDKLGSSVTLARSADVERLCGFPPMSVPPVGHFRPVCTIIDASLTLSREKFLLGGGGHPDYGCLISVEAMASLDHVSVVSDVRMLRQIPPTPNPDTIIRNNKSTSRPIMPTGSQIQYQKPFFSVAPPPLEIAKTCFEDKQQPNPLKPERVTVVGRISGTRRMARRLVFADLAPPECGSEFCALPSSTDHPWRSPIDGEPIAVQLIAGQTLCRALGDVAGPAALRRLKVGQLVFIEGKTNVGNRDSLGNWASKRSLDVVVFSYRILEESPQDRPMDGIKSKAEKKQLVTPVSASSPKIRVKPSSQDAAYLRLVDMLGPSPSITMVDTIETVNEFATEVSQLLLSLATTTATTTANSATGLDQVALVGIDCEWRPSFLMNSPIEPQPVLLLQIYAKPLNRVYLFDMQELFRPLMDHGEGMNDIESAASHALEDLFRSFRVLKTGFQVGADLRRLAASYPHVPAFRVFHAIVEVSTLARKAMQLTKTRNVRHKTTSLSRLTEHMTGKTLDKEQQISDWAQRPLSKEQIEYASLDAVISPFLLDESLKMTKATLILQETPTTPTLQIGRWMDDESFAKAIMSWKFMILEDAASSNAVHKLKAKRIIGNELIVTQYWPTGTAAPQTPTAPSASGEYIDVNGVYRIPSSNVRICNTNSGIVRNLVDERIGRSKEKCVNSLLVDERALPEGSKIEFHQRSGYVEFHDAVALFVNMPDKTYKRGYPNEWLDDGRKLTWFLSEREWDGGSSNIAKKLCGRQGDDSSLSILFVRMNRGIFLCCGRCRVQPPISSDEKAESTSWPLVRLNLELLDWEKLQTCEDFQKMANHTKIEDPLLVGSKVTSTEADDEEEGPKHQQQQDSSLDEMVVSGNVAGAMVKALKQSNVDLQDRSLESGLELLLQDLEQSVVSPRTAKARQIVKELERKLRS